VTEPVEEHDATGTIDGSALRVAQPEPRMPQHVPAHHLRLQYVGQWLSVTLRSLTLVVALALLAFVATMAWRAHRTGGLVVEAFSVPSDFASDGLTGQAVAVGMLDKLREMQAVTSSERPADTYQNDWGADLELAIPDVGFTVGGLQRLLNAELGHASHLSGEVFRAGDDVTIKARIGGEPPRTFTGSRNDVDSLLQKAAEAVYSGSQPYRFAEYLQQHDRVAEAVEVATELAHTGPIAERPWAYAELGEFDFLAGDLSAAVEPLRKSLAFNDDASFVTTMSYLVGVDCWLGHEEALLEDARAALAAGDRPEAMSEGFRSLVLATLGAMAVERSGDYAAAAKLYEAAGQTPNYLGSPRAEPATAATDYALGHDSAAARAVIAKLEPNDDASLVGVIADVGVYGLPGYFIAASLDDWSSALADARAGDAEIEATKASHKILGPMQRVWNQPLLARALAKTGDFAAAETLINTTPLDCYLCVRVRGQIAALRHDEAASDRWFAEAVRLAPSLPFAEAEWGEALLARGDLDGAIAKLTLAQKKGPHFADPLELWGEALLKKGDAAGAIKRFSEADAFAPHWAHNHVRWGQALTAVGESAKASAQFAAARGLEMSEADKQAIASLH